MNGYRTALVEPMHNLHLGVFLHVRQQIQNSAHQQELDQLNSRMRDLREIRFEGLRLPTGDYWTDMTGSYTAAEHRHVAAVAVAIATGNYFRVRR